MFTLWYNIPDSMDDDRTPRRKKRAIRIDKVPIDTVIEGVDLSIETIDSSEDSVLVKREDPPSFSDVAPFIPTDEYRDKLLWLQRLKTMDEILLHASVDITLSHRARIFSMITVKMTANRVPRGVINETINTSRYMLETHGLCQCLDYLMRTFRIHSCL